MTLEKPVLIIGAGVVGLILAHGLKNVSCEDMIRLNLSPGVCLIARRP